MFFKRDKHAEDIEARELPEKPGAVNYNIPASAQTYPYQRSYEKPREDFAPLFVKVEKYRDLLATIAEMKMFVSSMRQLFVVINDLEALRSDAHKIMRATVQRMEKSVIEVDSELLRPKGFTLDVPASETEVHQIEDSLTDIQKQMSALKRELEGMK